jgi:Holliday junction resolvasome RuvABC endonuclease subunit
VFFEAPLPDVRQTSARLLLGLASHVESTCYRYNVQCREQAVQTIRLAVMGRGRFPTGTAKAHVMAWCNARGWAPEDDNAADAMVAWCFAIRELTAARKRVA